MRRAVLAGVLGAVLAAAAPAGAVEYRVDTTADGPGNCAAAGQCTLRAAVQAANGTPERDLVRVPAGTYDLTGNDLIVTIGDSVDVVGEDARTTTLREVSGGDGRVFLLEQDSALGLANVTVTGSRNASAVLLFGTGIDFRATNVTFTGNTAPKGAAVDGTGGAVSLESSTLTANTASGQGGAVYLGGSGSRLTAVNTTISGNQAPTGSGLAVDAGTATLTHVTLADALYTDGGASSGSTSLRGTIVGSCAGATPISFGGNVEPGTTCGLGATGDRPGADPRLAPLADNGGATATRLLQAGSAALDAAVGCPPPATDQRGIARPQLAACDAGAVEVAAPAEAPAPRLTGLRLTPARFRAAARGAALSSARRAPVGSTVRFRLDRPARVSFALRRKLPGRRAGRRCVRPTRANRRARRCTRLVLLAGGYKRTRPAGTHALRFRGRWRGRRLAPGGYRLLALPQAGETVGDAVPTDFRIVR